MIAVAFFVGYVLLCLLAFGGFARRRRVVQAVASAPYIRGMAAPKLTDAECAELARILRRTINADRFPLSPRVRRWIELLAKLEPPAAPQPSQPPKSQPWPPPKDW